MSTERFFQEALTNFTFDVACGAAIRHLADCGYSPAQIQKKLDYPASFEQIQKVFFEHLCDSGILLMEEPTFKSIEKKPEFVREYDSYGKPSFRMLSKQPQRQTIAWKESSFSLSGEESFSHFLDRKLAENGIFGTYVSCRFGLWPPERIASLSFLDTRQKNYLLGIPWPALPIYHKLTSHMTGIIKLLYQDQEYSGTCYFLDTEEKIHI